MQPKTKQNLRERILTLLRNQKEEERLRKSSIILKKLFKLKAFTSAKLVLFYASFDGEVYTFEMIKKAQQLGKKIGLPKVNSAQRSLVPILVENIEKDLKSGPYGIQEPKYLKRNQLDLENIDLVVVPGVAFDKSNNRLGRGGGYYDRFLRKLSPSVSTVALAFDFQIVERLPQEHHDVSVSYVLSN